MTDFKGVFTDQELTVELNQDIVDIIDGENFFTYSNLVKEGLVEIHDVIHYIVNKNYKANFEDLTIPYVVRFIRLYLDFCEKEEEKIEKRYPLPPEPEEPEFMKYKGDEILFLLLLVFKVLVKALSLAS